MWGDLFRDPWSNSFPRVQTTGNPFGFGGFYGERPRSFWEDPVYFPSEKPRRLSNRKKTRRVVEDRLSAVSDDERSIPIRFLHREKPSDKKVKEDENQTCPSQPKLSQHVSDDPIPIEIQFGDENGLKEGFKGTSSKEADCDESKQLSRDQASSVEPFSWKYSVVPCPDEVDPLTDFYKESAIFPRNETSQCDLAC